MLPIEPLGMHANQWEFLASPDRYVEAATRCKFPLVLETTRRQFETARDILVRLNGSQGEEPRRGLLLADDVGLGKTTVAAMVAWIVACAGDGRQVRILAPNEVMGRRWAEELRAHVAPLQKCAGHLDVDESSVKHGWIGRLRAGRIQVLTHHDALGDEPLECDLLIVDEAHRAKGEDCAFAQRLRSRVRRVKRVLILTATPFSIQLKELLYLLHLVGGDAVGTPVRKFSRALDDLDRGNPTRKPEAVAEKLAERAEAAVEALGHFVIRHGVDDLPEERKAFGERADWTLPVPPASMAELELLLRADRVLRCARDHVEDLGQSSDPRFHVGWQHLDEVRAQCETATRDLDGAPGAIVARHLEQIRKLRRATGDHSKLRAVGEAVRDVVAQDEKVVLFCHHIATAQELTAHLAKALPPRQAATTPPVATWREAWDTVLEPSDDPRRANFIEWLCKAPLRHQTWGWLGASNTLCPKHLAAALKKARPRSPRARATVAEAAQSLYQALLESPSSAAVLATSELPGAAGAGRVLGVCQSDDQDSDLFVQNKNPDALIAVFNSPFGPDVLVATDRLSEGIDLHRYCRHLVHYELDPSPIRTVQRNGRLRRVNGWASVTAEPIRYAFPAFGGTRDHRLVQIMKKRIDSFALLLGGVQEFDVESVTDATEQWRNEVIAQAKKRLEAAGTRLRRRS